MSHSTYNKLWRDAQEGLSSLLSEEVPPESSRPERDRVVFFQRLASLYVRYTQIFRRLEEAYDQIAHPQKRRLIRGLLDATMGRVLELKNEMVEKEFSEFHYMDDVILDLKLTPEDLEIPIPRYFLSEQSKVQRDRQQMLSRILDLMATAEKPKPADEGRALSLEEAVKMIQVTERARQGRLRAKFMREIQRDEERQKRAKHQDLSVANTDQAAVRIQKVWKGFIQRKKTKQEREEEMIFLGMAMEPGLSQPCPAAVLAEANKARRRARQEEHEEDFQKALVFITSSLRETEGPDMRETMKDQIRQWFIECHDATGSFPDYPEEEDGGSALIFAAKTPQQLMEELKAEEEEEANKKTGGKEQTKDKRKGQEAEEDEEPGLKMLSSAFLSDLQSGHKTFVEVWKNRDESKNFSQRHEAELIKEEKRKEIETEIRLQVDELMRQELANWKLAVDRDKGRKAKPSGKKKKGSKSEKKKKKEKDLTADRTIESLYQELVEQGLLKPAENVKLQDYIGDYNYLGTTLRQMDIEPMPSLSDVRQLIPLYAILPLGSQVLREKAPLVKALLLVGPSGVGKKMLVHAICQETGANLFDLSPLNLVGKYPGRTGLQMMLHMVFKVARLLQPSVVWIGDAEKMFYKKVPKEEKELDPKRLKKDLPKVLKSIKGEDRILIIGTTNSPLNADLKSLCKVYTKIILIPRPDYGTRYVMWKELIKQNGGMVTSALDLSSLGKVSDGYTPGQMVRVVRKVLTEHRLQRLTKCPLLAVEFVSHLAKIDPIFQEEEEALKAWYAKTPLGKKRVKMALGREGEVDVPEKGSKDAKKKGKK
ncbi:dynein regulatory complex protein 11 [Electrophorus electricus]|uniref:dynein regulatory complex protein 11 n=1 Tax=Electrophorus electricus TaxID=8005 RepID=UPI0015CFD49A|nr:dynein regulatory complex protein 11 [Electrophorus electricus]